MSGLEQFHDAAATTAVVTGAVGGAWGLVLVRRERPGRRARAAWGQLLAATHAIAIVVALTGFAEARHQHDPPVARLYSLAVLAATGIPWTFRTSDGRWNTRMFSLALLVLAGLCVRALQTG